MIPPGEAIVRGLVGVFWIGVIGAAVLAGVVGLLVGWLVWS